MSALQILLESSSTQEESEAFSLSLSLPACLVLLVSSFLPSFVCLYPIMMNDAAALCFCLLDLAVALEFEACLCVCVWCRGSKVKEEERSEQNVVSGGGALVGGAAAADHADADGGEPGGVHIRQ